MKAERLRMPAGALQVMAGEGPFKNLRLSASPRSRRETGDGAVPCRLATLCYFPYRVTIFSDRMNPVTSGNLHLRPALQPDGADLGV